MSPTIIQILLLSNSASVFNIAMFIVVVEAEWLGITDVDAILFFSAELFFSLFNCSCFNASLQKFYYAVLVFPPFGCWVFLIICTVSSFFVWLNFSVALFLISSAVACSLFSFSCCRSSQFTIWSWYRSRPGIPRRIRHQPHKLYSLPFLFS